MRVYHTYIYTLIYETTTQKPKQYEKEISIIPCHSIWLGG